MTKSSDTYLTVAAPIVGTTIVITRICAADQITPITKAQPGDWIYVRGLLTRNDTGGPLLYFHEILIRSLMPNGELIPLRYDYTLGMGDFNIPYQIPTALDPKYLGIWNFQAVFEGEETAEAIFQPSESSYVPLLIELPPPPPVKITTKLDTWITDDAGNPISSCPVNTMIRIYADLTRVDTSAGLAGKYVALTETQPDGTVVTVQMWETTPEGRYYIRKDVTQIGLYSYYSEFLGDETYEGCEEKG